MTDTAAKAPATLYHNVFYPSPPSVHAEDWTSFDRFTTRAFTSDFCHSDNLTVNVRLPTTKGGYAKVTNRFKWDGALRTTDQLRLWFPVTWRPSSFVYIHTLNDKVRVHYDHGFVQVNNQNVNLYGSLDFRKNWTDVNARVGASHTSDKVHTNFRLRYNLRNNGVDLYHKTQLTFNEWKLGFVLVGDLTNKALLKKDLVLGYEKNNVSVYLKGLQSWDKPTQDYNDPREYFSTISLTGLFRRNNLEQYGVEVVANPERKKLQSVTLLAEYQHSLRNRIKAKINNSYLLTLFLERKLNSQLTVALGAEVPLDRREKGEVGAKKNNNVGLKLSWNL